ncbi:MAG: fatty acid hydroxylase [Bacteroidetes bacterium]|nr:MAG: fatty acid hydroxylase [Bacteroidota bacterium]
MYFNIFVFIVSFVGTEILAWAIHKYVMHGFLWNIHKTHHEHNEGFFELNDIFSLFFGTISTVLIVLGANNFDYRFFIGLAVAVYGMLYFVLHDVLIHKRIKFFGRPKTKYLSGIAKAHRAHHKSREKSPSESFGLLWVSKKYFDELD